ncbi:MAG: hypothetical protein J0L84_02355 [Verrucomicrobia bacterium]|nr:hypothetical protein [Verrucomicrobiota bacterium]
MHPALAELTWGGGEFLVTAGGAPAAAGPTVAIHREASGTTITFMGLLQAGISAAGPWADVVGADTPFLETSDAPQRFYRSRDMGGVFEEEGVVRLVLQGPLQRHFELAFAGLPDGIFPPVREKPWFPGSVRVAGEEIRATLRVRGNSSLQECPFPKLKFKVAREDREGTPFAGAREVKVGSHCAEGGRGSIGRLREEAAVYREAMAYEVMHLLGFLSPRVERARVTYRDTSPPREGSETGWTLTRNAMLLDDAEVVAERLGGRALDDDEITALTDADFDAQTITDLRCFHVLLGNWDFALSVDGRNLWNTEVIERADGRLIPVAGDFDLASWVTEEVQDTVPHDYLPELPLLDRRARYELEVLGKSVTPAQFAAAKERFASKRSELESLVQGALVDEVGRTNALRHLTVFQNALAATQR